MNIEQIRAANRASALEQLGQDERTDQAKADMMADRLGNGLSHPQYDSSNYRGQELTELIRSNAQAVEVETHRHDEQNN